MISFKEMKPGNWVLVNDEGQEKQGEVTHVNMDEGQIGVRLPSGLNVYFLPKDVSPLPLNDEHLTKLRFEKETTAEGFIKYKHGPFRLLLEHDGDFSHSRIWYREDKRQITYPLNVHQLQNHYRDMTNVDLAHS